MHHQPCLSLIRSDTLLRDGNTFTEGLLTFNKFDEFVPASPSLRVIRTMVDQALAALEPLFVPLYAEDVRGGRSSIASEMLLRAMLLQVLYSTRSECLFVEQAQYILMFRWFISLSMEGAVWVPMVFTKNYQRLIGHDVVVAFFNEVLAQADRKDWLSKEHFSVVSRLIQTWAGHKSLVRRDRQGDGDSGDFLGRRRSNETHESATDRDSRLHRKRRTGSVLRLMGHTLMENRNGLIVNAMVTQPDDYVEREVAKAMTADARQVQARWRDHAWHRQRLRRRAVHPVAAGDEGHAACGAEHVELQVGRARWACRDTGHRVSMQNTGGSNRAWLV